MAAHLKSEKGYFYKPLENGEKKRSSQEDYKQPKKDKKHKKVGERAPRKLSINIGNIISQGGKFIGTSIGDCVKELIEASYNIYYQLVNISIPITIVCGGQSPSYYCLAMMHLKIFNPNLVNIVILPHSKGGVESKNQINENIEYCKRLKEKGIELNNNVVIIDGVHSGTGIRALESALEHCFPNIEVYTIAINAMKNIAKISVDAEIILPCEPKFSDLFPRLVNSFHPRNFKDKSKFITEFINLETNPVAEMIIDIAQDYPETSVEDTKWYKYNHEITSEMELAKEEQIKKETNREMVKINTMITKAHKLIEKSENVREIKEEMVTKSNELLKKADELMNKLERNTEMIKKTKEEYFTPIVLTNPKRYQCPICKNITGYLAPLNPSDISLFTHRLGCPNKFKIPIE